MARVRELAPTLPLLIPGIGAQGGDAEATVRAGWRPGAPIIVSSSRAVLYAGSGEDFAAAARARRAGHARRNCSGLDPVPETMPDVDLDVDAITEQEELRPAAPRAAAEPHPALLRQMTRAFLVVAAVACAAGEPAVPGRSGRARSAGDAGGDLRRSWRCVRRSPSGCPTSGSRTRLTLVLTAATVLLAGTALALGWGLAAPALPALGLLVCVLCAAAGWRAGAAAGGGVRRGGAGRGLLGAARGGNGRAVRRVPDRHPAHRHRGRAGRRRDDLAGGGALHALGARTRAALSSPAGAGRRCLLGDRPRQLPGGGHGPPSTTNGPRTPAIGLGLPPWELPNFGCDAETLDQLQADLGSRVPFRDLPVTWTDDEGRARAYLVSGEPRYDERGVFKGYWGVARDVTDVNAAREALAATETRYQELFTRIPTPLVLHRGGRVIDANPSAVAMFGHPDLQAMLGSDLLTAYESGDSRERARRRMEMLQGQRLGTALPVTDYRLLVRGRRIAVRATGVRVDAEGGPGDAGDLRRRHRAPGRRTGGAPLGGHAVAPGGHQPRPDHAHRHGQRPLRHGQPHLRAPHRLDRGRGGGPHRRWSSASGPAPRTASASSR